MVFTCPTLLRSSHLLFLTILILFTPAGCSDNSGPSPDAEGTVLSDAAHDRSGQPDASLDLPGEADLPGPDANPSCPHPTVTENCENGWCVIPPGCFLMGSPPDELCREPKPEYMLETLHEVTLTHSFEIAAFEVSQEEFENLMGYTNTQYPECGPSCPVDTVFWDEAAAYCNALSASAELPECYTCQGTDTATACRLKPAYEGEDIYNCKGYRLPTEAEWEYAYRAGTVTSFYNGAISSCTGQDSLADEIGWYWLNSDSTPHPVGEKVKNDWGLFDMAGNIAEWVQDQATRDLTTEPVTDPAVGSGGTGAYTARVIRGGSFFSEPYSGCEALRAASRKSQSGLRGPTIGFRCVKSLLPQ